MDAPLLPRTCAAAAAVYDDAADVVEDDAANAAAAAAAAVQAIGKLQPEAAAQLGLPAGVPVAPGSGDNMMSALGAGITR